MDECSLVTIERLTIHQKGSITQVPITNGALVRCLSLNTIYEILTGDLNLLPPGTLYYCATRPLIIVLKKRTTNVLASDPRRFKSSTEEEECAKRRRKVDTVLTSNDLHPHRPTTVSGEWIMRGDRSL